MQTVLLMLLYIRAEREGEFSLHLYVCKKMNPYFFCCWSLELCKYVLSSLDGKLTGDILNKFMQGEHVMRHQNGLWNGVWSGMTIETNYMKYGKDPSGMIGFYHKTPFSADMDKCSSYCK